ncbi:MAG: AI-2E family transporter [Verrucomicrobia bacterium]|nr:MAG: AI-2E family transporter [Verrucomicrobiota bacterium]
MEPSTISGTNLRTAFVLLLVVAVTALFLAVTWPFFKPLLLGALLAGLFHPLYRWITRLLGGRASLGAAVTLLVLLVLGLGPVSAFLGIVLQQALTMSDQAIPWLSKHLGAASTFNVNEWLVQRFPALAKYMPSQEQLVEQVGTAAKTAGAFLVSFASRMTATTAAFVLNLFVMLYAMFFFFRDGHKILERIFYYTPLSDEDETRMLSQLASITRATVKGTLVIGVIQGALAGIAFWVTGIEGAALWGTIMTILSIIPGIGAALVWVPAVIILFVTGQYLTATLLAAWCAAVVGTVDNFLRPVLVGRDAKMPDLLILIGTLGGLFLFGPIGFIVGPIVCGLFLTVWDIYGATFREVLPPVTSFRPPDQDASAMAPREPSDH